MKTGKAKTGFLAGILLLILAVGPAMAEQKEANPINVPQTFNIEAGSLEEALDNYSRLTGIKPVYLNELVAGKRSPGVHGIYSPEAAVKKILKGTGLTYMVTNQGTAVLKENKKEVRMVVAQREAEKREPAEEKEKVKRPVEIEEMVVTATKTPINVQEVPASVNVVTWEDMKLKARTDNFYDAVRNVPGVYTVRASSMGWPDLRIRGQQPAILINGRDTRHFATSYTLDSTLIGMGAVERIEMLKGPQSTMHGGKAISGTINIITKKGDRDHPYVEANILYGDSKELRGGLSLSGGYDKLSYYVNVYGDTQDEWDTPEGKIPFVEHDRQNLYARLDYDILKDHVISLEYMYNDSRSIVGGKGYQHEKAKAWSKKIWDLDPIKLQTGYLTYEGDFTDWFSLYVSFGGGENDLGYTYGYNGFDADHSLSDYTDGGNKSMMKNDFLWGEVRGTFNLLSEDRLRFITGVQYKESDLDWTTVKNHKPDFSIFETETYTAPYAEVEFRPIPHALLLAGVRYDDYNYDEASDQDSTNPRFGLSVFPFAHTDYNWTTLWGSYTEAFNPPNAMQLHGPAWLGSNPNLEPEETEGWEYGLKQRLSRWAYAEFSYFDVDYENLIKSAATPGGVMQLQNVAQASLEGYEFLFEVYPTDWLTLHFAYTDLERRDETADKRLFGQPDQMFQYGMTVTDLYGFSGSLWGRQYSDYKNLGWLQADYGKDHPSEDDVIWDMKILYRWDIKDDVIFEPFLLVENLTDEKYYDNPTNLNIMEGRAWHVGASLRVNF
ncbi:MAG: TonB-dependent receptor [Desulfobacterales bacterium]|nr:TonB-dependent receptor [Desulfobacterales bacterium]